MGVSRPTEMTIRDMLQEELRKRGVTVAPEFSVSTPTGQDLTRKVKSLTSAFVCNSFDSRTTL